MSNNDVRARATLARAFGATGPIQNEKQYWNAILTALTGSPVNVQSEKDFTYQLGRLLGNGTIAIVRNNQAMAGTGGTYRPTIANGVVTGGTWTAS